jgi:hypothetical protein
LSAFEEPLSLLLVSLFLEFELVLPLLLNLASESILLTDSSVSQGDHSSLEVLGLLSRKLPLSLDVDSVLSDLLLSTEVLELECSLLELLIFLLENSLSLLYLQLSRPHDFLFSQQERSFLLVALPCKPLSVHLLLSLPGDDSLSLRSLSSLKN